MLTLRSALLVSALSLGASAFADYTFGYDASDTRTVFQDASGYGTNDNGWDGQLQFNSDATTPELHLNSVDVVTTAGFDPNIQLIPASGSLSYYDYNAGHDGTYNFGDSIASGSYWDVRRFVNLDAAASTAAALGTYDFSVEFRGGADASASDVLQTLDLHVEVFDKLDVNVGGSVNDINTPGEVAHLKMSVTDNMTESFVSSTWFIGGESYHTNPSDPSSPNLDGNFNFDDTWFDKTVAPGDTLTGAHSDWKTNASSVIGTYHGRNGVVGGLHNGDNYFIQMGPTPDIHVNAVPEPASLAALGLGALGLLRRPRKS